MASKRQCCVFVLAEATLCILCVNEFFFSSWRTQPHTPVESEMTEPMLLSAQNKLQVHKVCTQLGLADKHSSRETEMTETMLLSAQNKLQVHKVCTQLGLADKQSSNSTYSLIFAKKYKLAYIRTPKIGSTFFKMMFHILNFGVAKSQKIMDWSRAHVHANAGELVHELNRTELNRTLTIIPARNPFSRLFATYVDKVYLPFSVSLGKSVIFDKYMRGSNVQLNKTNHKVGKNLLACTVNVSFQDFIDFELSKQKKKAMFDHYGPVSALHSDVLCNSERTVVVKQETFADDIEHVLKTVNVSGESLQVIQELLHGGRAEFTVRSVIKALYIAVQTQRDFKESPDCWTWPLIVQRIWKAFQMQGFISKHVTFPYYKFSEKEYHDKIYVIDVILKTIEGNPLSLEQSREQRREALITEYEKISESALNRIRKVYRLDFEMFNYSTDLDPY